MKRVLLLIGLIASTLLTFAQPGVEVSIEPIEMMIGEQAQVTVTVQAGKDDKVEFPTYQPRQQIVAGVEVIAAQHPSDNTLQLTLTSFDGNLYYLPPFKVKVNGKKVKMNYDPTIPVLRIPITINDINATTTVEIVK